MKRLLILLIVVLTSLSYGLGQVLQLGHPEEVGVSADRLNRLNRVIQEAIEKEEIPGAVLLVARKGKIIFRKAFGWKVGNPGEKALSIDSIFDVASMTKVVVTATSMMILVEDGRLALTDEVAKYIPKFGKRRKDEITLLQLLTHFSGLRPDLDLKVRWKGYENAIRRACNERLIERPGKRFIYSDINYLLLGEVVSRVSGKPLDEFAKERIFVPLGMTDSEFKPGKEKRSRIVPTEKRDGKLLQGVVHDPTSSRMGGVAGHAGLFSTVNDVATWAQMILQGGIYGGIRVLSPLAVLKMTTPQTPVGQPDWRGIGFDIETRFSTSRGDLFAVGSFGHTGFTGTSLWIDPYTETLVILFTSRLYPDGEGDVVPLRRKVASVVGASLIDVPLERGHYYNRY